MELVNLLTKISIAENFKEILNKTIILAPEKIQSGWKKYFDPRKEDNQYALKMNIMKMKIFMKKIKKKLAKKRIKEYYEMHGYLAFQIQLKNILKKIQNIFLKKI